MRISFSLYWYMYILFCHCMCICMNEFHSVESLCNTNGCFLILGICALMTMHLWRRAEITAFVCYCFNGVPCCNSPVNIWRNHNPRMRKCFPILFRFYFDRQRFLISFAPGALLTSARQEIKFVSHGSSVHAARQRM